MTDPLMNLAAGADAADREETAGILAPPPFLFAIAATFGIVLEWALPSLSIPAGLRWPAGGGLVLAGTFVATWFLLTFRRARTPVDATRPTTMLVTAGPYRFSRNPGYLSLVLYYVGGAALGSAVWLVATLLPTLVIVQMAVIHREERYLRRRFGSEYELYGRAVRRWI